MQVKHYTHTHTSQSEHTVNRHTDREHYIQSPGTTYNNHHSVQVAKHAHLYVCIYKWGQLKMSSSSPSCRGSRPSWALVGAGCRVAKSSDSHTCQHRARPSPWRQCIFSRPSQCSRVGLAKAIDIVSPALVNADRSNHALLEDGPSTALQVTPHIKCLPTAGVYGVHTGLPASSVVDVLVACGSVAGVRAGTWGRGMGKEGRGRGGAAYSDTCCVRWCCLYLLV